MGGRGWGVRGVSVCVCGREQRGVRCWVPCDKETAEWECWFSRTGGGRRCARRPLGGTHAGSAGTDAGAWGVVAVQVGMRDSGAVVGGWHVLVMGGLGTGGHVAGGVGGGASPHICGLPVGSVWTPGARGSLEAWTLCASQVDDERRRHQHRQHGGLPHDRRGRGAGVPARLRLCAPRPPQQPQAAWDGAGNAGGDGQRGRVCRRADAQRRAGRWSKWGKGILGLADAAIMQGLASHDCSASSLPCPRRLACT